MNPIGLLHSKFSGPMNNGPPVGLGRCRHQNRKFINDSRYERSFNFNLQATGKLELFWTEDGSSGKNALSTVATGVTDGDTIWLRVTLDVDDGGGNRVSTFYTSTDGTTWTPLGDPVTVAATTSIHAGTAILAVGALSSGSGLLTGDVYRAQIYDGIDGTLVFDFDPSKSFTVDQANSAVITINRTASAAKSVEVTEPVFSPHTDDYFITSASPISAYPFTLAAKVRGYPTAAADALLALVDASADNVQYGILTDASGNFGVRARNTTADDAHESGTQYDDGSLHVVAAVFRSATDREVFVDGVSVATDTASVAFNSAVDRVCIGAFVGATPASFADSEGAAWAVFDEGLSVPDVIQLGPEFGV